MFTLPTEMNILTPILQQGQFWYKRNDSDQTLQAIEIIKVTAEEYHYREWRPTVRGMRHAVWRQLEWTAPSIEIQTERQRTQEQHTIRCLTHQVLMGARNGFGQNK
jgi:hypothetical protein